MALLLVPAGASAASPVLEFVVPGHSLPISFTTESGAVTAEMAGVESLVHCTASQGEGQITGPRSAVSKYRFTGCATERGSHQKCKSTTAANEEEITTGPIDAELVYIDQARREVGMLLNPGGGTYIAFECGGEAAEGKGPFLARVGPLNQEATSFTATLDQLESVQTPDEYENEKGERLQAIPIGSRGTHELVPTGVEASFTIHSSFPGEIRAITAQEIEAKQHEAEAKKQEEALQKQEAALKKLEEALKKAEEHAKQVGEEAKKHEEELNAQIAAIKKKQEEEAKKKQEESKPPTRGQLLSKALAQCKKGPKSKRAQCIAAATKKYGHRKTGKK
jgi:molecular chaperone DnaK (HSP70)